MTDVPKELVEWLRHFGNFHRFDDGSLTFGGEQLMKAADEIERLQRIIDSRPAINAALPESYIEWSHNIYATDIIRASERKLS